MSALYMKLIGAGIGLLILAGLIIGLKHYKGLAESRGEKLTVICQATRDASGQPNLKCGEVPKQIKFMGEAIGTLSAALDKQNAAVKAMGAETVRQQAEAAKASHNAQARARAAEATSQRLIASARSTVPSRGSAGPCGPSKALQEAWR